MTLLLLAVAGGSLAAFELRQPWARNTSSPWLWVGLLAAGLVGALGLILMETWLPDARPVAQPARSAPALQRRIGLGCVAAALALVAWDAWRLWPDYHVWHGTVIPWVAALVLTASAGLLLGAAAPAAATGEPGVAEGPPLAKPFPRWLEVTGFLAIAVLAVALRVYKIDSIPAGIYVDETNGALDALYLLQGRPDSPFGTGWYGTPSLYTYYMAGVFKVGGVGWLSLKAVSLIPAVLTVLALYPLGRLMFGPLGGLSAMAFMAASRWHLSMSRWGWNETAPPLFQILATFFLLRGLRDRRASDFAFGGLISGLMMYTYLSSRLALATLGVFALYVLLTERGGPVLAWRRHWRGLVLFLVAWVVAVAPIAVTHITDPFTFSNRVGQISVFNDIRAAGSYRPLWLNVLDQLKAFHQTGDLQSKHNLPGEPETDPLVGALFVIGLAYATVRLRDHRRGLLWLWLLLGLAGGVFSNHFESPQSYRTLTAVPAIALLAGDVVARLARAASARRDRSQRDGAPRVLAPVAGVAFAVAATGWAASTAWEADVYFERQAPAPEYRAGFNPIENGVARDVLAGLDAGRSVYVSPRFAEFSPLRFLAYGWQQRHHLPASVDDPPFHTITIGSDLPVAAEDRDVILLFDRVYWPLRDYILRFYPHARFEMAVGPDDMPTYVRAWISKADVEATHGVVVRVTGGTGEPAERVVPAIATSVLPPGTTSADWHGWINVPLPGSYTFSVGDGVGLAIDGAPWHGPGFLARGLHALAVELRDVSGHPGWQLRWRLDDGPETAIPDGRLCRMGPPDEGLTAVYFANTTWSQPPSFSRVTPFLLLTWEPPDPFPQNPEFSIRFLGSLRTPASGAYGFRLEADDSARLWIDRKLVAENTVAQGFNEKPAVVRLAEGLHDIRIDYVQLGGGAELRVYWTPPKQPEGLIPPSCLLPASPPRSQ
jgi:4-amino-4-deoxy-L-arabinose transferase-like glycosyltransferase